MATAHASPVTTKAEVRPRPFIFTSIGRKYLMGLTGLIWAGFIFAHMAGNLLMFVSADAYNAYGHALTSGKLIYAIEAILILAIITHVGAAIGLTLENRAARGAHRYAVTSTGAKGASLASKTMAIQGSVILAFIILHIAGFKYGTYYETTVHGETMRDLHRLIIETFKQPAYAAWYIVALVLIGFHLSHGIGSIFQSFGIKTERMEKAVCMISRIYAIVVAGGFLAQPIYVLLFA